MKIEVKGKVNKRFPTKFGKQDVNDLFVQVDIPDKIVEILEGMLEEQKKIKEEIRKLRE